MRVRDYFFRIVALAVVWFALVVAIIDSTVFMPTDMLEVAIAGLALLCGLVLTFVIWCGPQVVAGLFRSSMGGAPTSEPQDMAHAKTNMAMIVKQNEAIIALLNEIVERIEGPDPDY